MVRDQQYWRNRLNAQHPSKSVLPSEKYKNRWDVKGSVDLRGKKLDTLPLNFGVINGDFNCENNYLMSLEGAPIEVNRNFVCTQNKLTNLKGLPKYIGNNLYFHDNPLEHLNHLLDVQIKGKIYISDDNIITIIKALQNTNLDVLEYTLSNHTYRLNDDKENQFYMYIEQIIIKKRLELILV